MVRAPVFVIFSTVLLDLIGFGMVIPLVGIYGRHYGASGFELGMLGSIYSLMGFFFAPIWGSLSDRYGRRPILLISLLGSSISYLIFGLSESFSVLFISRAFAGLFSGNVSAAQAFIADVTKPEERAKGMGLIGAAFGLGFTLGPPIGGIMSAHYGLGAPGLLAAGICFLNFLLAVVRLPESLKKEDRKTGPLEVRFFRWDRKVLLNPVMIYLMSSMFLVTFAFSNMEQTFSLLLQAKFGWETGVAAYQTGLVLMFSAIVGAVIQGGLIRRLVSRFGEWNLLSLGTILAAIGMALLPGGDEYSKFFIFFLPLTVGAALINPTLIALTSKNASSGEQGVVMGTSQSMGALARIAGPFAGLTGFSYSYALPYAVGMLAYMVAFALVFRSRTRLGV